MDPSLVEESPPSPPTPELQVSGDVDVHISLQEKSVIVDNQPKVCFRPLPCPIGLTGKSLAAKPSQPMASTNVHGGDKNVLRVPVLADGLREWSFGLLDCFADLPMCLESTVCCWYVYSRNHQRFVHLETQGVPLREPVERYNHDCLSYFWLQFCFGAGWGLQAISRSHLRRRYGIRGDGFTDVLSSACCIPCELVQEHREIQLEESSFY